MVGTMIAREPIIDTRRMYYQEIIVVTRSFHDKFYIVSMGMNSKSSVDSHFYNVSMKFSCWNSYLV